MCELLKHESFPFCSSCFLLPDCSRQDILKKVCKDKVQEPLPADCPESLRELINACRAYDSFQRPSAGGRLHQCHLALQIREEFKVC